MLNQFKHKTQFIIITHNPRTTTEAADAVYGVTMQEPGVSSVVSVRLRGGNAVDEAAEARAESIARHAEAHDRLGADQEPSEAEAEGRTPEELAEV
jgi:chromosome segregation protein